MRNHNLADEIKWLPFRDSSHKRMLLCLLARSSVGTADDLFVPLYLLAAAGSHSECFVGPAGIDFAGIVKASAKMDTRVMALIKLAEALADPDAPIDVRPILTSFEDTADLTVAMHAVRMKWET